MFSQLSPSSIAIVGVVATILSGILSAVLTYHYPAIYAKLARRKALPFGLIGTWDSTWQTNEKEGNWVVDRVSIVQKGTRIVLENNGNPRGYHFKCVGRFMAPHVLVGEYKSVQFPKHDGAFILLLVNSMLVGFFLGPAHSGFLNFGAWVLTRGADKFTAAKAQLKECGPSLGEIFMGL